MAHAAAALSLTDAECAALPSVEEEIRAFIDGETNGEPLLHALYDYVLDEPIPARLLETLLR
ncbi:MAG: hypothetical protein IRZ04_06550 [Rhodospirillales bacterium]|nr:hypothetical protein [Rhodospirillales bacterium]